MSNLSIILARMTLRPVNSQQRPEESWLVRPLVFTTSEKRVSIGMLSAFRARVLMAVVLRALRRALSAAVPSYPLL